MSMIAALSDALAGHQLFGEKQRERERERERETYWQTPMS
jgi:hypothetical protein